MGLTVVPDGRHNKLVIDEDEANVLRTATKLITEDGCGVAEACARLNALGFKPRRAGRWDRQNLRRALRQVYLKGKFLFGRPGRWGNQGDPIPMDVPAILDRQTYDSLQAALETATHRRGRHASSGSTR